MNNDGPIPRRPLVFAFPVFNEEQNVGPLLDRLAAIATQLDRPYLILPVNDGSRDRTADVIREHAESKKGNVRLVEQPTNLGVARAFERIFQEMLDLPDPWAKGHLVTLEGDNTSDLAILAEMIRHIEERGSDVVFASCYAPGGKVLHTNWWRRFLSTGANVFCKTLFGMYGVGGLHTLSAFYRVHSIPQTSAIVRHYGEAWIGAKGFECMVEMAVKLRARGAVITEVPTVLDGSKRAGKSKMRIVRTIRGYLALTAYLMLPRKFVALLKRTRTDIKPAQR